jgi:hypothetical protein
MNTRGVKLFELRFQMFVDEHQRFQRAAQISITHGDDLIYARLCSAFHWNAPSHRSTRHWTASNKAKLQPVGVMHRPGNCRRVAQGSSRGTPEAGPRSVSSRTRPRNRPPGEGLLGSGREVTGSTVKISAVVGFDNLETSGNAVRSHNPRLAIVRRNFGIAGVTAPRAPKTFNPMVACGHRLGMTQISKRSYVVKTALRQNQRGPLESQRGLEIGQYRCPMGNRDRVHPEAEVETADWETVMRLSIREASR